MQGGELHLTNKVGAFKDELYARCFMMSEEMTHKNLRVKVC